MSWLLGKKGQCPASGSEPSPPAAEMHQHRGKTPAMRKCASPFLKGSGSSGTSFPRLASYCGEAAEGDYFFAALRKTECRSSLSWGDASSTSLGSNSA